MHPWEPYEIQLTASKRYDNPYTQVDVWADLEGPGLPEACLGLLAWRDRFAVRVTATAPGTWRWTAARTSTTRASPGIRGASRRALARGRARGEPAPPGLPRADAKRPGAPAP